MDSFNNSFKKAKVNPLAKTSEVPHVNDSGKGKSLKCRLCLQTCKTATCNACKAKCNPAPISFEGMMMGGKRKTRKGRKSRKGRKATQRRRR